MVALLVLSLKVDFIGLIFVIVYVGAIATLFLFIIMMLGGEDAITEPSMSLENYQLLLGSGYRANWLLSIASKVAWYVKHTILDIIIAFIMSLSFISLVSSEYTGNFTSWLDVAQVDYTAQHFNNVYMYGVMFYNNWYIPFLLAAVVLLIAMLGSIILTTRLFVPENGSPKSSKEESSAEKDKRPAKKEDSILDKYMKQQKREEKVAMWLLPLELLWTLVCYIGLISFKTVAIVNITGIYLYSGFWLAIYGIGVYAITRIGKRWFK